MALGYFPKLYPDELLCSAVARYRVHTMASFHRHVNKELYYNKDRYTSVALPHNLTLLHEQIGQFVGMSPRELAYNATLFPYYAAFRDENSRNQLLKSMLEIHRRYEFKACSNIQLKIIKICPDCFTEDTKRFGEAYWHRTHQLDCVHFCTVHLTPLIKAITRYGGCTPLEPLLPITKTKKYLPYLSETSKQRLLEISELATAYLEKRTISNETLLPKSRLNEFRKLYSIIGGRLNIKKLRKEFINFFGEQAIEILELQIDLKYQSEDWLDKIFSSRQKLLPHKRIAFEIFSKNYVLPRTKYMRSIGYIHDGLTHRAWRCQNPAAEHFGQKVITNVYVSTSFKINDSIVFKCSCGFTFRVKSSKWNRREEPNIEEVCEYGAVFIQKVRKLYHEGMGICHIADKFNAHKDTISRLIRRDYKILDGKTNPDVYEAIAVAKRIRKARTLALKASFPSYEMQDKEMAERIWTAASSITMQIPSVKITARRLLEVSKIEIDALVANPHFPRALSAILNAVEPYTAFFKRQRQQNLHNNL
ncbi:TnsD family Tn7-like transposition protein [Massilia sp. DD77]|uniref:TnsD family Tn7-like transposition protein n=1 Tax=Massilia sp. DD77 TaxID=3109349 RepID=UPI002FFF3521